MYRNDIMKIYNLGKDNPAKLGWYALLLLVLCSCVTTQQDLLIMNDQIVAMNSRINKLEYSYLWPYGLMIIAGLIIWLEEGIIHNPSHYPDYSYFIIGNTAIFLSMGRKMLDQRSSTYIELGEPFVSRFSYQHRLQ